MTLIYLLKIKLLAQKCSKRNSDASERTRNQREIYAKAFEIFSQPENAETKAQNAIKMNKEVAEVLQLIAWKENDNELMNNLEQVLGRHFSTATAMNKMIANVVLEKCIM